MSPCCFREQQGRILLLTWISFSAMFEWSIQGGIIIKTAVFCSILLFVFLSFFIVSLSMACSVWFPFLSFLPYLSVELKCQQIHPFSFSFFAKFIINWHMDLLTEFWWEFRISVSENGKPFSGYHTFLGCFFFFWKKISLVYFGKAWVYSFESVFCYCL